MVIFDLYDSAQGFPWWSTGYNCVIPVQRDMGLIPGWGTKIAPCGIVKKEKKNQAQTASRSLSLDPGSIPGSGRSPGEGNGNPLQYILAWRIPWREEPDGLQSTRSQRVGHD